MTPEEKLRRREREERKRNAGVILANAMLLEVIAQCEGKEAAAKALKRALGVDDAWVEIALLEGP